MIPKIQLKAPGKTFVTGEYLATLGGPALLLTTQPCFELNVFDGETKLTGIKKKVRSFSFIPIILKSLKT